MRASPHSAGRRRRPEPLVYLPFLCRALAFEIQIVFSMETRLSASKDFFGEREHVLALLGVNTCEW